MTQCRVLDPAVAEAMCFREALSWFKDRGFSYVEVESDALVVVNAINHNKVNDSYLGSIVLDCIVLLRELPNCKVFYVKIRWMNQIAYTLIRVFDSMFDCGV